MEDIKKLIAQAKLRQALEALRLRLPSSFQNEVLGLLQQLTELERSERLGLIDFREASMQRNKITMAALDLCDLGNEPAAAPLPTQPASAPSQPQGGFPDIFSPNSPSSTPGSMNFPKKNGGRSSWEDSLGKTKNSGFEGYINKGHSTQNPDNGIEREEALEATAGASPDDFPPTEVDLQGKILCRIPREMNAGESTSCAVRIAFDEDKVRGDLPKKFKVEEIQIISRRVELKIGADPGEFKVHFVTEPILSINFKGVTEWIFRLTPLRIGEFTLDLVVYAVLGPEDKTTIRTFEKSIQIRAEKANLVAVFEDVPASNHPLTHREVAAAPKKILFLSANPGDQERLSTDREFSRLRSEYERGRKREAYTFLPVQMSVTIHEMIRAFNDLPDVIHFSGHGGNDGIFIVDKNNNSQELTLESMTGLFKNLSKKPEVVVLNACHSAAKAAEISKLGIAVIGNALAVNDKAAMSFSEGFYMGLGEGKTYTQAFNDALIIVKTEFPFASHQVELWKNGEKVV